MLAVLIREGRSEWDKVQAVSSAKSLVSISVARGMSLMKQRNRMGPKIVP